MSTAYTLIRSNRKTLSLEIRPDETLVVRAPQTLSRARIDAFIASRAAWIQKHRERIRQRAYSPYRTPLTVEEITALYQKAEEILPGKVAYWAALMHVEPTGITITGAEKRFGSCSGKHRLSFSYRLMRYPEEAIDYVVVHELAHICHPNHAREFYALVALFLPDYQQREAILKT